MAHQAHNIPWTLLAANLRWLPPGRCPCGARDLHPCFKPNQGKELTHFVKAFIKNLNEHSTSKRKKYPETYDPPKSTDVIVDEEVSRKISRTVRRWRDDCSRRYFGDFYDCDEKVCGREGRGKCQCPAVPEEERKVSAFCRDYLYTDCYQFMEMQKEGFFNLELVKTLILHGEMEPILRACNCRDISIDSWQVAGECGCGVSIDNPQRISPIF